MEKKPILCIVGPTASGKTDASVCAAARLGGEIVSADSVQVYRGMDIGSAKPTPSERGGIAHHMIDCADIGQKGYSVSAYCAEASACILDIQRRNKTVIVVGGSGLYVQSLTKPLNFAVPSDAAVRAALSETYERDPAAAFARLRKIDPATAGRLHENDKKRVVRALEIYELAGKPLSSFGNDFHNDSGAEPPFPSVRVGLTMDRALLYGRIERRVEKMLAGGLVDETRAIFMRGYAPDCPALSSIGYAQLFAFFRGETTLPEAVERIKQDTRRYAKRQMTWFRRDEGIVWIDVTEIADDAEAVAARVIDIWNASREGQDADTNLG